MDWLQFFGCGLDESSTYRQMLKMKKIKRAHINKRPVGRPRTTGKGTLIGIRCHEDFLSRVDDWQLRKAPELSRPQAIKELAEIGLKHQAK